jgi:hypothetical protein
MEATITRTIEKMVETEDIRNSIIYRIIQELYEGGPNDTKNILWDVYYKDQEEHRIEAMLGMEPYIKSAVVIHHPVDHKMSDGIEFSIRGIINLNDDFTKTNESEYKDVLKTFMSEFSGENGSQIDFVKGTYSSCLFFEINY